MCVLGKEDDLVISMAGFGAQYIPSVVMGVPGWGGPEIGNGRDMNILMTMDHRVRLMRGVWGLRNQRVLYFPALG